MSRVVALLCSRLPQVAALALISSALAGCSADMSTRVSQDPFASRDPFSNPFASRSEATGTVPVPPRTVAAAAPVQQGGATTIIVGTSDTLDILAQRYRVTPAAILAAN